jgi:hypothetical protein
MSDDPIDLWVAEQLEKAPTPTPAQMRRVSAALFGGRNPYEREPQPVRPLYARAAPPDPTGWEAVNNVMQAGDR